MQPARPVAHKEGAAGESLNEARRNDLQIIAFAETKTRLTLRQPKEHCCQCSAFCAKPRNRIHCKCVRWSWVDSK